MDTRTSDNDLGYFDIYKGSDMYEAMCKINPAASINGTTPHYGPFLYLIGKIIGAHTAVEVGQAEGWSSGFMAWAIKENNIRYGMNGRFFGIDISDKSALQKEHDKIELPSTFIQDEKGSVHFLENQKIWQPESIDLIFIDGLHCNPYLIREVELFYPLLKGNGNGYLAIHDVHAMVEDAWPIIIKNTSYQWEHISFLNNYGFGLLRKMNGWDYNKKFWPDGDQHQLAIEQGVLDADGKVK